MIRIDKSKLFGLLHDAATGAAVQRQVRILKVGIGVPAGPDIHVWISPLDQKWCIEVGSYPSGGKRQPVITKHADKAEAWKAYVQARKTAPERKYPRKVPYFTFLRMGADGNYVHDFDAIEQHGPAPSEIEIVFLDNDPLEAAFQMFTAAELKCEGNGLDARRRLALAATPEEKRLAAEAEKNGEKFFPIIGGCYTKGCPYPKEGKCKPHGRLFFQLVNSPRIGGTCTYDTTSFRSIPQLQSGIDQIKTVTGRGNPEMGRVAGIPLKLVLRPYKVSHDGKSSTQFGVSIEYRASNAVELARMLIQNADEYHQALQLGTSLPEPNGHDVSDAIDGEVNTTEQPEEESLADAAAMEAEFFAPEHPEENGWDDPAELEQASAPKPSMPRRKSEAVKTAPQQAALITESASTQTEYGDADVCVKCGATDLDQALTQTAEGFICSECQMGTTANGKVIDGIQFPLDLTEGQKSVVLLQSMSDEAARAGVNLYVFCTDHLGLKPNDLNEAAARCMVEVLRAKPDKKK